MRSSKHTEHPFWDADIVKYSVWQAFKMLLPMYQIKNPIMFTVYIGTIMTTGIFISSFFMPVEENPKFVFLISIALWITLYFANFAEALAEGRGKSQAKLLQKSRRELTAKKLLQADRNASVTLTDAHQLRTNDLVLVEAGDFIPGDGTVMQGIASVNESAITGESAPVIREAGGDLDSVTGGTQVLSDWLIIRIDSNPGHTFIDHMVELVEDARRKKSASEISLFILLIALTSVFLLVCATLLPFSIYSVTADKEGAVVTLTALVALFVCLAPTSIGGLLTAISISGMDRLIQANLIAVSPRVVETAGDIDTLILDKTGTITLGNRQAVEFIPLGEITMEHFADAAQLASLADETPEGRSIVVLAKEKYGLRARAVGDIGATFIPFTAQTRMSGANLPGRQIRKGASSAIAEYVQQQGGEYTQEAQNIVDSISRKGGTALVVAEANRVLGVINLKDVVKGGLRERFAHLRAMGIKTIMVTGDNPLTTAAIAAEAGVDDFLADALPEDKLTLIRNLQSEGHLVAMTGDGTNDSPALAQADIAVAMNSGTQAAKEAGNLVDLDSNPTKVIEVVEIGKQLLMTRGALTTFSLANDVSKNFAVLPAALLTTYPILGELNIMRLATPESAILSAVIFNSIILVLLIPSAIHGVRYEHLDSGALLRKNALLYGFGGLVVPFIGIKLIDFILVSLKII